MYVWIWRKLPYGTPGKLVGVILTLVGVLGLLWFAVFPAVDKLMPFNDVQVTPQDVVGPSAPASPSPSSAGSTSLPR